MGFFSRLWRIIRGKGNEFTEAIEDANFETVIKQNIRDMEKELNKVIKASAESMSNYNRLEAEYQKNLQNAEEWKDKAKKALASGNEELAKKALAKKADYDRQVAAMEDSVSKARAVKDKLRSQVEAYKGKIEEAKRNASTLIARKNAAAAQKKVSQVLAGIQNDSAFGAIDRFSEKVDKEEATALAYEDMAADSNSELDKEFSELDVTGVDNDLEQLKQEMMMEKDQVKRL